VAFVARHLHLLDHLGDTARLHHDCVREAPGSAHLSRTLADLGRCLRQPLAKVPAKVRQVDDIAAIVSRLREYGAELPGVEVKSAAGGFPDSLTETFSAFGNLPGGGLVILGLDEANGFKPVKLADPHGMAAAAASRARNAFDPPLHVTSEVVTFESKQLVAVRVSELPAAGKPCVVLRTGKSYLRFADGDYELAQLEREGFIANRGRPQFDAAEVPRTSVGDLEAERVEDFLATARAEDKRYAGISDDSELLRKTGVVTPAGTLTQAGLLALGDHPQQFLPHCTIRAAMYPEGATNATRALDSASFTGPIAAMVENAVEWVQRNSRTRLETNPDTGFVRSITDPPPAAMREVIANSLVHRDLADWASSRAVDLRIHSDHVRMSNPGGLYGISVERLGVHPLTSARNRLLVDICRYVRTSDGNVVEALASGIPATFAALDAAGLPRPEFFDQGLTFTVVLRRFDRGPTAVPDRGVALTESEMAVFNVLTQPMSVVAIASALGITSNATHKRLSGLRDKGIVEIRGGKGQRDAVYARKNAIGR
jgi:ATP-dependent DNA helicase RecG